MCVFLLPKLSFISEMTIHASAHSSNASDVLRVERPYYEQHQFNNELNYSNPENDKPPSYTQRMSNIRVSRIFFSFFPIFKWLPQYSIKNDLFGDIISGCTVAIMHIPQGKSKKPCRIFFLYLYIVLFSNSHSLKSELSYQLRRLDNLIGFLKNAFSTMLSQIP